MRNAAFILLSAILVCVEGVQRSTQPPRRIPPPKDDVFKNFNDIIRGKVTHATSGETPGLIPTSEEEVSTRHTDHPLVPNIQAPELLEEMNVTQHILGADSAKEEPEAKNLFPTEDNFGDLFLDESVVALADTTGSSDDEKSSDLELGDDADLEAVGLTSESKVGGEEMSQESGDQNAGSDDQNAGSDDQNTGSDDQNNGSDERNTGSDDQNAGSDDQNAGSDDQNTGSDDQNAGSDDQNTGSDDQNAGLDDQNTGSDDQNSGSDDQNAGSDDQNTGSDDQNAGSDDQNTGSDDQSAGSDDQNIDEDLQESAVNVAASNNKNMSSEGADVVKRASGDGPGENEEAADEQTSVVGDQLEGPGNKVNDTKAEETNTNNDQIGEEQIGEKEQEDTNDGDEPVESEAGDDPGTNQARDEVEPSSDESKSDLSPTLEGTDQSPQTEDNSTNDRLNTDEQAASTPSIIENNPITAEKPEVTQDPKNAQDSGKIRFESDKNDTVENSTNQSMENSTLANNSSIDFIPHVPEEMAHWWKRNTRTGVCIVTLFVLGFVMTVAYLARKGHCGCSGADDGERRGLARDYQQNNGAPAFYKNDSYDPL